jgi:hypothetical protein
VRGGGLVDGGGKSAREELILSWTEEEISKGGKGMGMTFDERRSSSRGRSIHLGRFLDLDLRHGSVWIGWGGRG